MAEYNDDTELIQLERENEIQLTVWEPGEEISIQLIAGSAEIFGSELQINNCYDFSYFSSFSIFTWHGCTLKIKGCPKNFSRFKIKASTQIPEMWDLHKYLEESCEKTRVQNITCPTILVTGPTDVGKSTLLRYLLNCAAKHGRKPLFVDLDVGQSALSITGTFGVLPVHEPSNVHGKFSEKELSVHYFGYKSPGHNMTLYKLLVERIGQKLKRRLHDPHVRTSEVFIDTCGWIDGAGYRLIKDIIEMLNVNIILVLSNNPLYSKLKKDVSPRTKILYVDRFKDVVVRNRNVRIDNRNTGIDEYFYGVSRKFNPHTIKVDFADIQIFKANYTSKDKSYHSKNSVMPVPIEPHILHQVLGVSYAEHIQNIPLTSIYGFVCVTEIDMDLKVLTLLSPRPGPLPTSYLLMGDITFNT